MGGGYELKMVKCCPRDSNPRLQCGPVIFFYFSTGIEPDLYKTENFLKPA